MSTQCYHGVEANWEPGFWQRAWVQNVLPFLTSMSLHITLIVLAIIAAAAIILPPPPDHEVQTTPASPDQLITKDTVAAMLGVRTGVPDGIGPLNVNFPETRPDEWGLEPVAGNGLAARIRGGGSGEGEEGVLGGYGFKRPGRGHGWGSGKGNWTGDGDGNSPFGYRYGNPKGTEVFIAPPKGEKDGVRRVAYVCDASGSMLGQQFDLLRDEIVIAVNQLSPIHSFDVLFFRDEGCAAFSDAMKSSTLLVGTTDNKAKLPAFLGEVETRSGTNPIPALRHAFAMNVELIYLLTDGAFNSPDNDVVVAEVRRLNAGRKVKINTIAFYRQDVSPSERILCDEVLAQIARENGGQFRVVLTSQLLDH